MAQHYSYPPHDGNRPHDARHGLDQSGRQGSWGRREDFLQGLMGPPAGTPLPVDPSLDNLRSTADQVSPTFFGSGVPQGETTSIFRAPQVSVGQWTTYPNQITDIHNLPPDPVDRYAVTNGPQDVWSPYRSNGPPANAPSQIPSKRRQIPHSDSGYETRSLATGSVHSTQLVEDPRAQQNLPSSRSITQPYVNSQGEQHLSSSRNRIQQYAIPYETMYANGGQQTLDFTIVAEALQQTETIQCDHSGCTWTGKCPSELKKHQARHERIFRCNESGCNRKDGFATINDLDRHKKCVHNIEPKHGFSKSYKCFAENCPKGEKIWPRLDNFRQHLGRMHKNQSIEALVTRSEKWYDKQKRRALQTRPSHGDTTLHSNSRENGDFRREDPSIAVDRSETNVSLSQHRGGERAFADGHTNTAEPFQRSNTSGPSSHTNHSAIHDGRLFVGASDKQLPFLNERSTPDSYSQNRLSVQGSSFSPAGVSTQSIQNSQALTPDSHKASSPAPRSESQQSKRQALFSERPVIGSQEGNRSKQLNTNTIASRVAELVSASCQNDEVLKALRTLTDLAKQESEWDAPLNGKGSVSGFNCPPSGTHAPTSQESISLKQIIKAGIQAITAQNGPDSPRQTTDATPNGLDGDGQHKCPHCPKRIQRPCDMKKHIKRHNRPYGCTFNKCNKTFGSKNDWKRHENSQHFQLESWRCHEPEINSTSRQCARLFFRRETFGQHLSTIHKITDEEKIKVQAKTRKIGRNGQTQFWCGFCKELLQLRKRGLDAWDERFNHIDDLHFKKGQRIREWLPSIGHQLKGQQDDTLGEGIPSGDEDGDEEVSGDEEGSSPPSNIGDGGPTTVPKGEKRKRDAPETFVEGRHPKKQQTEHGPANRPNVVFCKECGNGPSSIENISACVMCGSRELGYEYIPLGDC